MEFNVFYGAILFFYLNNLQVDDNPETIIIKEKFYMINIIKNYILMLLLPFLFYQYRFSEF
ncbi:MAG: hypothetical protein ACTSYS_17195 [Promethearchaeota archaeon]